MKWVHVVTDKSHFQIQCSLVFESISLNYFLFLCCLILYYVSWCIVYMDIISFVLFCSILFGCVLFFFLFVFYRCKILHHFALFCLRIPLFISFILWQILFDILSYIFVFGMTWLSVTSLESLSKQFPHTYLMMLLLVGGNISENRNFNRETMWVFTYHMTCTLNMYM